VFFKPCGFTNEEFSTHDRDFHVHCQRVGHFGRPLSSSTWHDNVVTGPYENEYYNRVINNSVSASNPIEERAREISSVRLVRGLGVNNEVVINNNNNTPNVEMPLLEDISDIDVDQDVGNIRCISCNQEIDYNDYPTHKNNCEGPNNVEAKIKSFDELLRRKFQNNENDNEVICLLEDNCYLF
jgi:hypothetical protein